MNSFLMLQGLETLPGRMEKHCDNALKLAYYLSEHPDVSWVNYPALATSAFHDRAEELAHRLESTAKARNQVLAILTSMVEGVIAVDDRLRSYPTPMAARAPERMCR